MLITFWVSGEPKPQPRPRAFAKKMGAKFVARVYDDGSAEGWKSRVALAVKPHLQPEPIDEPLSLAVELYLPRPGRLMRRSDPADPVPHTGRPDADNFAKAIMDALTQVGLWRDDGLIYDLSVKKHYTAKGGRPGAQITVATEDPSNPTGRLTDELFAT